MTSTAVFVLAFGLSMDAFAAALIKGVSLHKPKIQLVLRIGLIFGLIEAISPIIGWCIGVNTIGDDITIWNDWIVFFLLSFLGIRMIIKGFSYNEMKHYKTKKNIEKSKNHYFLSLIPTAIVTSIDALAIGISVALLKVNIYFVSLIIALTTTIIVIIGVFIGSIIGSILGKWAEIFGGVVLIIVGFTILNGIFYR